MKTLILDYSKWRCGGNFSGSEGASLGKGYTEEKISQLRKLLKENELKLRVINKPKIEKQK